MNWVGSTTGSTGCAPFSYTGTVQGSDTVQVVAKVSGIEYTSNPVTVSWALTAGSASGPGPQISIVANSNVVMPNPLLLSGTVSDPALPNISRTE